MLSLKGVMREMGGMIMKAGLVVIGIKSGCELVIVSWEEKCYVLNATNVVR